MTKRLKYSIMSILFLICALAFVLIGYTSNINATPSYAVTDSEVFNFDTWSYIDKGRAAESDRSNAIFSVEEGLLHLQNATDFTGNQAEGFYFTYSGTNLADHAVDLEHYDFFKIRMKRINCGNNNIMLYLWDTDANGANFLSAFYIGSEYDNKWVDLTISLTSPVVYVKDLETGIEKEINIGETNLRNPNPTGDVTKLRFYFSKMLNTQREAYAEFFGFFKDKATADAYNGNATEKLEKAENYLRTNELSTEFALAEYTEEKLVELVSYYIEENANINVSAEILNYQRYAFPTKTEKGFIYFDVNLYSGGKVAYVENVKLIIDEEPSAPIMYKFDNEETINQMHGTAVTKYLYNGVMKVIQPDYHQADGFWLYFDTTSETGEKDPFLLQSYSILQWRIMFKGQGPNQFFFNNYNSLYYFGLGYEEEVWLTVQFDTSKCVNALKILNESTGEIFYENAPNPAGYSTDYDPPAFRGWSGVIRYNMGRRSDLERWALVDYFGFFPTIEQADEYGFEGKVGVPLEENVSEKVLFTSQEQVLDNVNADTNTSLALSDGLNISLANGKTGDTAFTSKTLSDKDLVDLSKLRYLRLGLKDRFTGNIVFTVNTDNGTYEYTLSFSDQSYKLIVLDENLGTLKSFGVKVKGGETVTMLYAGFFKTQAIGNDFNYAVASELSFNTNYLALTKQEAAYCYTEAEALVVANSILESVAGGADELKRAKPENVEYYAETVSLLKPTKSEEGAYNFKVVLSVGGVFGLRQVSETLTIDIEKIRIYNDGDDYGTRSTITDFMFGGEGYAKSQSPVRNSTVKTVEFTVDSDMPQDAYIVGNSEFAIYSTLDGELVIKVNGETKFTSSWLELFAANKVISVVFGEQESFVYENGLGVGSFDGVTFTDNESTIYLGGNPNDSAENYVGFIKEVKVFDKERSEDEIFRYVYEILFVNDDAEEDGSSDGLINYWRIKESNGGFVNRVDYTNNLNFVSEKFYNGFYHEFVGEDWLESLEVANVNLKTVETWILQSFKDVDNSIIMRNGDFKLGIDENGYVFVTDGVSTVTTDVAVNDSNYHHIAFTFNGQEVKYYLDGAHVDTYQASLNTSLSNKYYFGGNLVYNDYSKRYEPESAYIGRLANFKVFNTVRTETEIVSDMADLNKETSTTGLDLNLSFDISKNLVFADTVKGNDVTIKTLNRYKLINEDTSDFFTMVAIPDPQDYVVGSTDRQNGTWDSYDAWRFYNPNLIINNWIVDNVEKQNIGAVITLGDLTQNATELEFRVFEEHMSVLDGIVPYTLVLGNHDYESMYGFGSSTRGHDPFELIFPYEEWSKREYYGGSFEEGDMDNTYYLFDFDGEKYLIMCLEFMPRDEVLEWFDYICKKYSDHKVIMTTHNYIGSSGQLSSELTTYGLAELKGASANNGMEIYEKLMKNNPNIIQGINGHVGVSRYLELENVYGDLIMNASFDTWSDTINNEYKIDGRIALCRYYEDGTMGFYLYDAVEDCYYATNYRWEADMSGARGNN